MVTLSTPDNVKLLQQLKSGFKRTSKPELLGTLGACLLGNMLTGKGIIRAEYGSKDLQSKGGKGIVSAGYGSKGSCIIRMNQDLMEFILEIIYLIKDGTYGLLCMR